MENIIIKGINGEIEFGSAYLMNKNTLAFRNCSLENSVGSLGNILLNENYKGIEIKSNKKKFIVKMNEDDFNKAIDYKKNEYLKFKDYYGRLVKGTEEVICYLSKDSIYVRSTTAWDKGYAPYWDKMFRFMIEKSTQGLIKDNDDEVKFQNDIYDILKLNIGRHDVNIIDEGGDKYFKVDLKTFINYLME